MRNYIHADLKRILSRASHTFSMLLLFAGYAATLLLTNRTLQVTSVSLINSACGILGTLLFFFSLFEMLGVFSEEFKVKTMQVAIGLGVTRSKVVISKLLEVVILLVMDMIVVTAITVVVGAMLNVAIPMNVLKDLLITLLIQGVIAGTITTSITMIVLFATQSNILAIFTHAIFGLDVIGLLLMVLPLVGVNFLENLNLDRFTFGHLTGALESRLALGSFDFKALIGLAAYLALGVFGTCKVFGRRELDF